MQLRRRTTKGPSRQPARLSLEQLEDRCVPAFTASLSGGLLDVDITGGDDVTITRNGEDLVVAGNDGTWVSEGDASRVTAFDIDGDNGSTEQVVRVDGPFVLSGDVDIRLVDTIQTGEDLEAVAVTFQGALIDVDAQVTANGPLRILPSAESGLTIDTAEYVAFLTDDALVIGDASNQAGVTITGAGINPQGLIGMGPPDLTVQTAGTLTLDAGLSVEAGTVTLQAAIVDVNIDDRVAVFADGPIRVLPSAENGLTIHTLDAADAFTTGGALIIGDASNQAGVTITGAGIQPQQIFGSAPPDLTVQTAGTLTLDAGLSVVGTVTLQAAVVFVESSGFADAEGPLLVLPSTDGGDLIITIEPRPCVFCPEDPPCPSLFSFTSVTLDGDVALGGPTTPLGQILIEGDTFLEAHNSLLVEIEGTTPGTGHDQLLVTGVLTLAEDVTLHTSGSDSPLGGDQFVIVDTTEGITGEFAGLPEGATISNFLGSGRDATITYVGGEDGHDVVLMLPNRPPAPPADGDTSANEVDEGAATGTTVGITAQASDPDGDPLTYRLTDDAGGRFAIDPSTGVVTVANGSLLDGPDSYRITVEAEDPAGLTASADFTITVRNVPPTIGAITLSADSILEGQAVTVSGSFSDPARGQASETFSGTAVWSDGTSTALTIDSTTGTFSTQRPFPDDNPTGTPFDPFTVRITISDDDGGSDSAVSPTVTVHNVAPTIRTVVLSSASIQESESVVVSGTFDDPALGQATETFTGTALWSDGQSTTLTIHADGTFTTHRTFADDHPDTATPFDTFTVDITLRDDDAGTARATSPLLTVYNEAPTIGSFSSSATLANRGRPGEAVTLHGTFSDPARLVATETFAATIDWGDESTSPATIDVAAGTFTAEHAYAHGGIFPVTVTLRDDDTGQDQAATTAIITGVGVVGDVLYVIGSDADDHVSINNEGNGLVKVHADFLGEDPFTTIPADAFHQIIAYLGEGGDHLTIAGNLDTPAIAHGEAGNDHLGAGGGPAVLLGGLGEDLLLGGAGFNVLIGGGGADRLVGGTGEDLLIGGSTAYDHDDTALMQLLQDWALSDDPFAARVTALRAGSGASGLMLRLGETVFDDGDRDVLTGSSGLDWFFVSLLQDEATDKQDNEGQN